MRASIPLAFLASFAVLAGAASPSAASLPTPGQNDAPCAIALVPASESSTFGTFEVVARGVSGNPIPHEVITVDFSACGSDVRIALQQPLNAIVDCGSRSVSGITDGTGHFTFRIVGGSSNAPAVAHGPCVRIFLPTYGRTLAMAQVMIYDLGGANGLDIADLSLFLQDFFTAPTPPNYAARSDYDYLDGGCTKQEVGIADLSRWLDVFFTMQGATHGSTYCP